MKKTILTAIASMLIAGGAQAEPYDLRGFKLGMTLDEFRAAPYPDEAKYEGLHVLCSGDAGADRASGGWELNVYRPEKKVGVIRCNHFRTDRSISVPRVMEANMNVAGVGVYQTFEFAPAPGDGALRLFRISIRSNMQYWDQFWSGYTEKFGKPSNIKTEKVQNKMGAAFDKMTATWANKESSITLEQRTSKVDHMGITYLHHDIGAHVVRQIEAIEGKPSSKL